MITLTIALKETEIKTLSRYAVGRALKQCKENLESIESDYLDEQNLYDRFETSIDDLEALTNVLEQVRLVIVEANTKRIYKV